MAGVVVCRGEEVSGPLLVGGFALGTGTSCAAAREIAAPTLRGCDVARCGVSASGVQMRGGT